MDYESIGNGLKVLGYSVMVFSAFKYLVYPLIKGHRDDETEWGRLVVDNNRKYTRTLAERSRLVAELGKTNRPREEIEKLVDSTVPLIRSVVNKREGEITIKDDKVRLK